MMNNHYKIDSIENLPVRMYFLSQFRKINNISDEKATSMDEYPKV